jgi:hypothetical protein
LNQFVAHSYDQLVASIEHTNVKNVTEESSANCQIEFNLLLDSSFNDNLRIMASIDNGGWRVFTSHRFLDHDAQGGICLDCSASPRPQKIVPWTNASWKKPHTNAAFVGNEFSLLNNKSDYRMADTHEHVSR